jgi:site-specific DNA-methyltransferase (adenine-specific)
MWTEVLRVLKPGGHLLAFGGTRTSHRMVCAIEDAGFVVRDSLVWMYGSGFPKSLNLGDGCGTALKPAHEPICLARKPLTGTVAANVTEHGTGAINVDGCRVGTDGGGTHCPHWPEPCRGHFGGSAWDTNHGSPPPGWPNVPSGRWPPNVLLDDEAAAMVDEQSGESGTGTGRAKVSGGGSSGFFFDGHNDGVRDFGDTGGASRFFPRFNYCAKASTAEREAGLDSFDAVAPTEVTGRKPDSAGQNNPRAGMTGSRGRRNTHPTVKPVDLMRWLVRLVTPPNGLVLDPFCGSGTTGMACALEGFRFVGIELDEGHAEIARARIRYAEQRRGRPLIAEKAAPVDDRQLGLFGGDNG